MSRLENGRFSPVYQDILTKEFLSKQYTQLKKSPYIIADEVGCSVRLVYDYLEHHGIPKQDLRGQIEPGMQFGLLTTIKPVGKTANGSINWLCRCQCDNTSTVPTSRLKSGRAKSCGCYRKRKKNHRWTGYCDINGSLVADIRCRARKKKFTFDLDAKFLWELWLKQEGACAISGLSIVLYNSASLDRIDSCGGYTKDNVWWVHKDVNKMKMDLSLDRLLELCRAVVVYNSKDK